MTKVPVRPEMLFWARTRAGLDVPELVKSFPKYPRWEAGEDSPTLKQLESLANRTRAPLGYFFLQEPPEEKLPVPDFRTVGDRGVRRPSPDLIETIETMQRRQDWLREYLIEEGESEIDFVGSVSTKDNPNDVASAIRSALQLDAAWARSESTWENALRLLRQRIEGIGVLVVINGVVGNSNTRVLDPEEFRGFVLTDSYAPLLFVNNADAKAAQMFTLAHELAHIWVGQGAVFTLEHLQPADSEIEKWCNSVAAEFLVPAEEVRACWKTAQNSSDPFQYLARRFKVSPLVAARRVLDLHLIARAEFFGFYNEYIRRDLRKRQEATGGGNFFLNQDGRVGRRFAETVLRATREGRLAYVDAYRLTGLHGETFEKYAKTLSLGRGS